MQYSENPPLRGKPESLVKNPPLRWKTEPLVKTPSEWGKPATEPLNRKHLQDIYPPQYSGYFVRSFLVKNPPLRGKTEPLVIRKRGNVNLGGRGMVVGEGEVLGILDDCRR